ncbi:MAG: hypothetical protein AAF202_08240, partial [Pseudomonadota bacterium]
MFKNLLFVALLVTGVFAPQVSFASRSSACRLEITHDQRAAQALLELMPTLNSDLERFTNGMDIDTIILALNKFRPPAGGSFFSFFESGPENILKTSMRMAFEFFFHREALNEKLVSEASDPRQGQAVTMELIAHMALSQLLSEDLRRSGQGMPLPDLTAELTTEERVAISLARLVLQHGRLCIRDPETCHPYILSLSKMQALYTSEA